MAEADERSADGGTTAGGSGDAHDGSETIRPGAKIRKGLLTGLFITLSILFVKWCSEHTTFYQNIQMASYSWLQTKLSPPRGRKDLPVVVLDISSLEPVTNEVDGQKLPVTPREPLKRLIEAVAAQRPKAIGLDVEFSPNEFGYVDPADPQFFRFCLNTSQQSGVPVYLGVHNARDKPPEKWLGSKEFAGLAASISVPEDNRKMAEWLRPSSAPAASAGEAAGGGRTMSAALAGAFSPTFVDPPRLISWAVGRASEEELEEGIKAREFLVDFSPVAALEDFRLKTINPAVVADQGWTLNGKAVLIGDGSGGEAEDTFIVPISEQRRPVKGIYLHACAAYTLLKAPLYELTPVGRVVVDLILSVLVLLSVTLVRLGYKNNPADRVAERRVQYLSTFVVTLAAFVVGVVFIHVTRVLWDDFLFVIVALWLHPSLEHSSVRALRAIKKNASAVAGRLFLEGRRDTR